MKKSIKLILKKFQKKKKHNSLIFFFNSKILTELDEMPKLNKFET